MAAAGDRVGTASAIHDAGRPNPIAHELDTASKVPLVEQFEAGADPRRKRRLPAADELRHHEQMAFIDEPSLERVGSQTGSSHGDVASL